MVVVEPNVPEMEAEDEDETEPTVSGGRGALNETLGSPKASEAEAESLTLRPREERRVAENEPIRGGVASAEAVSNDVFVARGASANAASDCDAEERASTPIENAELTDFLFLFGVELELFLFGATFVSGICVLEPRDLVNAVTRSGEEEEEEEEEEKKRGAFSAADVASFFDIGGDFVLGICVFAARDRN